MLVNNKQAMIGILVWQAVLIGLIYMHHMRNVISMSMMVNFIFYRRLGGFQVVLDHLTCGCSGGWVTSSMAFQPLKLLSCGADAQHLSMCKPKFGSSTTTTNSRRASKTLSDLRFLMEYIESKVRHEGKWIVYLSVESHTCVYSTVAQSYLVVQKKL